MLKLVWTGGGWRKASWGAHHTKLETSTPPKVIHCSRNSLDVDRLPQGVGDSLGPLGSLP